MKIKSLAITVLSAALFSSSLFAHIPDDEPAAAMKEMDKASPANLSIQTSVDSVKDKVMNPLHKDTQTKAVNPLYEGSCEVPNDGAVMGKMGNHPNICQETDSDGDDSDSDDDGDGGQKATDYNSSRSNKNTSGAIDVDGGNGDATDDDSNTSKVTDTNFALLLNGEQAIDINDTTDATKDIVCNAETEKKVCTTRDNEVECECSHL